MLRDAAQPGAWGAFSVKAFDTAYCLIKGFLGKLLCQFVVSAKAHQVAVYRSAVLIVNILNAVRRVHPLPSFLKAAFMKLVTGLQ